MSHFAQVINGIVTQVIVAEQDVIDSGLFGLPSEWVQTSYNTRGNIHYGHDNQPDNGTALRGNFAAIGYVYDDKNDVFYLPKPYPSWILNQSTWSWEAPVPYPLNDKKYLWDEESQSWIEKV